MAMIRSTTHLFKKGVLSYKEMAIQPHELKRFYPQGLKPALYALQARLKLGSMSLGQLQKSVDKSSGIFESASAQGKRDIKEAIRMEIMKTYPNMNKKIVDLGVSQLISTEYLNAIAGRFGIANVLSQPEKDLSEYVYSMGKDKAVEFVNRYFALSSIDWKKVEIERPDVQLEKFVRKVYQAEPVTRLLGESGRESPLPIYVVGVFAKTTKLGEGFGQSVSMAQHRARVNTLMDFYLRKTEIE